MQEFSKLPGIGRKTALRLVLYQLRQDPEDVQSFVEAIAKMKQEVHYCRRCHNISDSDVCPICADQRRDSSTICVVENVQDVMAVENTQQYRGLYHVLGGVISPMFGEEGRGGAHPGSHPRTQLYDGGRHHQFLYLPQTGSL